MKKNQNVVALTQAQRWWGLEPEVIRCLAAQDGIELKPSAWGAAIGRRDLRLALARRSIAVPAGLEEWPRVLVAADDMVGLKAVFDALDDAYPDAGVRLAHDGAHAARELDTFKPHLLIVDFKAPRFDASEICRRSRFSPDFPVTKVIAVGAQGEDRKQLLKDGAECLSGRFTSDDLAAAAARLLSAAPVVSAEAEAEARGVARLFAWR